MHLSDSAALLVPILIEWEHALLPDKIHCFLGIWKRVFYPDVVPLFHIIKELVSLGIEPSCVKTAKCPYVRCRDLSIVKVTKLTSFDKLIGSIDLHYRWQMFGNLMRTPEDSEPPPCEVGIFNESNILCTTESYRNFISKSFKGLQGKKTILCVLNSHLAYSW